MAVSACTDVRKRKGVRSWIHVGVGNEFDVTTRAPEIATVATTSLEVAETPVSGPEERPKPAPAWRSIFPRALLRLALCSLALIPLGDLGKNLQTDWHNHLWTIEYYARCLVGQWRVPDVLNAAEIVGVPSPVFYAAKFYAVTGALAALLGPGLTVRVTALLLLTLSSTHAERALREWRVPAAWSLVLALALTCSAFQLTTLLERGDVTEFAAQNFLITSVCTLCAHLKRIGNGEADPYGAVATGYFYGLAAATNPLTGMFGALLIGALGAAAFSVSTWRRFSKVGCGSLLLLIGLLAPWLYAVGCFARDTFIADPAATAAMFNEECVTPALSALHAAFALWNFRHFITACTSSGHAYQVHVQLAFPLLLAASSSLLLSWQHPRKSTLILPLRRARAAAFGFGGISLLIYCCPNVSAASGHFFDILQFPFRLGAYVNLSLFVALFFNLGITDWESAKKARWLSYPTRWGVPLLGLLVFCGISARVVLASSDWHYRSGAEGIVPLLKAHRWPVSSANTWFPSAYGWNGEHPDHFPPLYFWVRDYEVVKGVSVENQTATGLPRLNLPFKLSCSWGSVAPTQFTVAERTLVRTNVLCFPWNRLVLDGTPLSSTALYSSTASYFIPEIKPHCYSFMVAPGSHGLFYRFSPGPLYRGLQALSWTILIFWCTWTARVAWKRFAERLQTGAFRSTSRAQP